jgi:hypothetical protein
MSYQHPSGATKRKRKREEMLNLKNQQKIDIFCNPAPNQSQSPELKSPRSKDGFKAAGRTHDTSVNEGNIEPQSSEGCSASSTVTTSIETFHPETIETKNVEAVNKLDDIPVETEDISSIVILGQFPTDRANYSVNVTDKAVKRFVVEHGPCQPKGPFPRDPNQNNICFSEKYYERTTKAGLKLPVTWLCYSPKLDSVYCEPCWLFGDRAKLGNKPAWAKGIRKWKSLTSKIRMHEDSDGHAEACVVFDHWRLHKTIDEESERQVLKERNFWRQIVHRVVNVILTLATCGLAFRGRREQLGNVNSGNFLSIIELLAAYDPVLKELIERPDGTTKYLSPKVQNEVIETLSTHLQNALIDMVKQASFYAVIIDTTQDISKVDQMSEVFRYVTIESDPETGKRTHIKINESFLGFRAVHDQSAAGIEGNILKCMEEKGLDLSKCRGQGYDGAATMSGVYSGVQSRILEKVPNALYIHCVAHNLNLVLNDAVSQVQEVSQFFDVIQRLYTFFGGSIKRWDILSSFTTVSNVKLKALCPTRWSSREECIVALRYRYVDVVKALGNISLVERKKDIIAEALGLQEKLESFEFVFLLVVLTKMFESVNTVSKMLQTDTIDLMSASNLLQNLVELMSAFRNSSNEYDNAKETAVSLAQQWGVQTTFGKGKRIPKAKMQFDELCEDSRLTDPEMRFKVNVVYRTLDILINQVVHRSRGMQVVVDTFGILQPRELTAATDDELFSKATKLQLQYSNDISPSFFEQLQSFRLVLKQEIK